MKFEYLDVHSTLMQETIDQDVIFIKKLINEPECLYGLTVGVMQHDFGLYGVTSNRLIFCSTQNGKKVVKEYPLENVNSIHLSHTGLYNVRLMCGACSYRLGMSFRAAKEFYSTVLQLIETKSAELKRVA